MGKKKRDLLSPEVLAVLRSSPNLEPCRKFRHVGIDQLFAHLRNDKCEVCLAFFRELDRESEMICLLARSKNASRRSVVQSNTMYP
jgi:hypothetical protein